MKLHIFEYKINSSGLLYGKNYGSFILIAESKESAIKLISSKFFIGEEFLDSEYWEYKSFVVNEICNIK